MRKLIDLNDWIDIAMSRSDNEYQSVHLDNLKNFSQNPENELGEAICDFFKKFQIFIERIQISKWPDEIWSSALIYIPMKSSKKIKQWSSTDWKLIKNLRETPSFYIMKSEKIFSEIDEEYRRPVNIPIILPFSAYGIYRCFRRHNSVDAVGEFTRGIYIIYKNPISKI